MVIADPPPAYIRLEHKKTATFAEVSTPIVQDHYPIFENVLDSFTDFLTNQETIKLSKNQLELFRGLIVLVLETSAKTIKDGGDVSEILATSTRILDSMSSNLETKKELKDAMHNPSELNDLESKISEGFEGLEAQLRKLALANELEFTMYREELLEAQRKDRAKIVELEAIVKQTAPESSGNFNDWVEKSMEEKLKIIGDRTVGQEQVDAKRALAILAELTGKSLPPSTMLGQEFVQIGQEIHQGTNYDVFMGEYFTGEKIAIKQLRHRVDKETAHQTHKRFARQALNWSLLRHDAILPFYGIGVAPSPVTQGEFHLYMVSPHLQNQDARRYLKKYPHATKYTRLLMVSDVARGLRYMHEAAELPEPGNGIVHSALNIFNILIKDSGRAVISGFGHSKVIRDFQESFTGDNAEYRYMAPEMMTDEPHTTHGTDIWSWAMTSLEILTDAPAFGEKAKGPKIVSLLTIEKRPKREEHPKLEEYPCASELWDLFEKCWAQEASARPSADEIITILKPLLKLGKSDPPARVPPPSPPPPSPPQGQSQPRVQISRNMPVGAMIECLEKYYLDVTNELDVSRCGSDPLEGGGFADIYQGHLKNGQKVAIKCPRLWLKDDRDGRNMFKASFQSLAAHEIYSASKLTHLNLIRVIGPAVFRGTLAIISPWMDHGTVIKYLSNNPKADRLKLCDDICGGLAYMHGENIVHGDLKGANVLVSSDGIAKISDFGNTRLKHYTLAFTGTNGLHGQISVRWTPRELLSNDEPGDEVPSTKPTKAADVYSLGMTILEIMTGKIPFYGSSDGAVVMSIHMKKRPARPQEFIPGSTNGDEIWRLITKCWAEEPSERPSVASVVRTMTLIIHKTRGQLPNEITAIPFKAAEGKGGEDKTGLREQLYAQAEPAHIDNPLNSNDQKAATEFATVVASPLESGIAQEQPSKKLDTGAFSPSGLVKSEGEDKVSLPDQQSAPLTQPDTPDTALVLIDRLEAELSRLGDERYKPALEGIRRGISGPSD